VRVLCEGLRQRWFVADGPITAILDRPSPPVIRARADVLDPQDAIGWARGDPAIMQTERRWLVCAPDDGNPIGIAVHVLEKLDVSPWSAVDRD
jgi:hypothetical protein